MIRAKRYYMFTGKAHENVQLDLAIGTIEKFREMWATGATHLEICKSLRINENTLALLIIDHHIAGRIEERAGGIFGG